MTNLTVEQATERVVDEATRRGARGIPLSVLPLSLAAGLRAAVSRGLVHVERRPGQGGRHRTCEVVVATPDLPADLTCSRYRHAGRAPGADVPVTWATELVPSGARRRVFCAEHGATNGIPVARLRNNS